MYRSYLCRLEMASTHNIWFLPNMVAGRDVVYLADISPVLCLVTFSLAEMQ